MSVYKKVLQLDTLLFHLTIVIKKQYFFFRFNATILRLIGEIIAFKHKTIIQKIKIKCNTFAI